MVIVGADGRIALVNAQTEKLFGYLRAELLGHMVEMLIPGRFRGVIRRIVADTSLTRRCGRWVPGWSFTVCARTAATFDRISLSPIETEEGRLVSSAIRDVTARKLAEEKMLQSEERFRLLVQGVKDYAILMLDPEGRIVSWNEGAQRIKGYTAEEIIGEDFSRFYTPDDIATGEPSRGLKTAQLRGRFENEGWRVREDGSRFWANLVTTAMYGPDGELRGFSKVTPRHNRAQAGRGKSSGAERVRATACVAARSRKQGTRSVFIFGIPRFARAAARHRRLQPGAAGRLRRQTGRAGPSPSDARSPRRPAHASLADRRRAAAVGRDAQRDA